MDTDIYRKWHDEAKKHVAHWFTDVTEYDRKMLNSLPAGAQFIGALRKRGSNLIILDGEFGSKSAEAAEVFTFYPNDRFYIGNVRELREVSKERAHKTWRAYLLATNSPIPRISSL